jgi:hypothetical protein
VAFWPEHFDEFLGGTHQNVQVHKNISRGSYITFTTQHCRRKNLYSKTRVLLLMGFSDTPMRNIRGLFRSHHFMVYALSHYETLRCTIEKHNPRPYREVW